MERIDTVVEDVLAGNRDRFREVFDMYEATVRVVLAAMLPDRSVVDDLLHEVFVTAYLKLREYRPGTDFRAWVRTLARNLALNERRRYLRHRSLDRRYQAEIEQWIEPAMERLVDGDRGVTERLRECMDGLPDKARRLVDQYYFQGLSGPQIAEREKQKETWVRLVLFRARGSLFTCLESKGVLSHE